jgi:mannitol-1-phosphate/altronate dehydrogenase
MRKSLASRGLAVPQNVAMVITAVYLEKTHTMKALRDEEELACLEFRKWVIEQKKKNKKDPITLAKIEVSKV